MKQNKIKELIRTIPDWPHKGIMFRDVTTLLLDSQGLKLTTELLLERYEKSGIDLICGIEARGFIFGATLAHELGIGFIPIRKKGKLPGKTISEEYSLEYGTDTIEIHHDAIEKNQNVLIVDDLLATGGTALGAARLIRKVGGLVHEACFIVNLPDLKGHEKLKQNDINSFFLVEFEGE